jgi:hypothetical protein
LAARGNRQEGWRGEWWAAAAAGSAGQVTHLALSFCQRQALPFLVVPAPRHNSASQLSKT